MFLPPQWYGSPGSSPFPSICKLLAAFLGSSLVFARNLQHLWLPASHLLGTCYLLDSIYIYIFKYACVYIYIYTGSTIPPPHHGGEGDSTLADPWPWPGVLERWTIFTPIYIYILTVCMYVRTYVCMYVGMYVRTYVCMYVIVHV